MNPRQRRGVLLLVVAAVGAVGVFVSVSSYVSEVRADVAPITTVLRLTQAVRATAPIPPEAIEEAEMPAKWVPRAAVRERLQVSGLVAGTDLPAGAVIQEGMLVPEPQLEPGERELAILVDAETGVAGKVAPGSVVDVAATFPGDPDRGIAPKSEIVVVGARVIDVGLPEVTAKPDPELEGIGGETEAKLPVTFALSVREALVLTHAESFAREVRLALVRQGESSAIPRRQRVYRPKDTGAAR